MSLKTQLTDDMKQAMRDRDSVKLGAIRFLVSEIRNYEIDNGEQDDAGVEKIIARQVKQMKDAISEYQKGGREDLVTDEQAKVAVLEAYLPQQMSDEELLSIVKAAIDQAPVKQMGPIMQLVREKVAGQADGGRISTMVKEQLQA